MRYSKSKKADLSLSINAIVILILAITILGLGLTFVRGLFKKGTDILEGATPSQLANPPNSDNVLTLSKPKLEMRKNDVGTILVAYLNTEPGDAIDCSLNVETVDAALEPAKVTVNKKALPMKQDQINVWTAAVTKKADVTASTTGLYTFTMTCGRGGTVARTTTIDIPITINP